MLLSLAMARSLARRLAVWVRETGGVGTDVGSAASVSAATNRATAPRDVSHRPPTRTASSFTACPLGVRVPLVTQRKTVDGSTAAPPRCPGKSRPAVERDNPPPDWIS